MGRSYAATAAWLCLSVVAAAQDPEADAPTPEQQKLLRQMSWTEGPTEASLGGVGKLAVAEKMAFTSGASAQAFMKLCGNIPDPALTGVLRPTDGSWFVTFTFRSIGYVKDDDKDKIDADAILNSIREGTEEANKRREKDGLGSAIHVVGWDKAPFYAPDTNNLTWAVRGRSPDGDVINYNSRILGRKGVMEANLICGPDELSTAIPVYNSVLAGFKYVQGEKYAEYREGDAVADYGLAALIAGGAAAVAWKSGILGKLLKPVLIGIAAVGAAVAKMFKRKNTTASNG